MDLARNNKTAKDGHDKDNNREDYKGLGWCYPVDEVSWLEIQERKRMERKHRNHLVRLACRRIS